MKKYIILFVGIISFLPINIKAVSTSATSAILMDTDSNRILYAKDINNKRSVASISKIMTAILACEKGNLNKKITIGNEIDGSYGSGIYIKKGEKLTLLDLLYGLMLRSGNDASLAIAHNVGGSVDKFVVMMNELAEEIGMKNTEFNNPNGLDEEKGNYSTAYDMAILTSYAMKNKTYRKIVSTKKYTLKTNMNTYIWYNKNKLLKSYSYTTGGKTGFTKIARRTLVTTASKDNLNLVVVTLNDGDDFNDHKNLFEYAFENYKNYKILNKGNIEIDDDYYSDYKLYIKDDVYYPLSADEKNSINIKYKLEKKRKLKNNLVVGKAEIYLGDKLVKKVNIYVRVKEEKLNFFDKIKRWFNDK